MAPTSQLDKTYKALEVAQTLIKIADENVLGLDPDSKSEIREGITNLKLQKMLYFSEAAHLALFGKDLFEE